jgi:hypothetical protein
MVNSSLQIKIDKFRCRGLGARDMGRIGGPALYSLGTPASSRHRPKVKLGRTNMASQGILAF